MPSWKKIILSGSDAALNTLSVSNSITASVISASQFTGSLFGTSSWANNAITASYALTTNPILGAANSIIYFKDTNVPTGSTYVKTYYDGDTPLSNWSFRIGRMDPTTSNTSGSHILKDGVELFTNAKAVIEEESFVFLGFGKKNNLTLTESIEYEHPGVENYGDLVEGQVYAGSLKLQQNFYGVQQANQKINIYSDGYVVKPSSPGFLIGQGGFYIFESASMQFNTSGALVSPVESASVKFTLSPDSSSLSISVGKNDLREVLFISRSGDSPRIGIGKPIPNSSLDISGSVIITGNLTASGDLNIKDFPSVSASLASLASGVGTLQQVTDVGNTTSNVISSSFDGVGFYGTASWAINVVNGGGGGGGGSDSAFLDQSTAATTWSFAHNLGTQYPVITVYDTSGQVIIPQEIDGEDTNNLKIYFPTSQSGYATAVGGTSALTYYSQSLTTASVNLNTITFTKGDSSTFNIVVNTGSVPTLQQVTTQGASTTIPITASIISASSFTGSLFGTASWATNALTASLAPNYVLTSVTSSMLAPYVLNSQTSSFVQNSQTSSFVLNSQTSSMLAPYVLTSQTSSFVLNSQTSSMSVLSSSFASTASFVRNAQTASKISVVDDEATNNNYALTFADPTIGDGVQLKSDASTLVYNPFLGTVFIGNETSFLGLKSSEISTLGVSTFTLLNTNNQVVDFGSNVGSTLNIHYTNTNFINPITASIISASSFTGSLQGTASWTTNALTSSLATRNLLTASATLNTITFTKGDSSQFSVTVDTGSGGGGPSYITPPFDTGSILYWDGTKVTGSGVMDYDGYSLNIDTGYFSVTPETQFGQDVIIYGLANLEAGARIYQDTVADAIVIEKADVFGTSGSYGYGSHILRNFSSTGPTLTPGRIVYISGSGQWAEAIASGTATSTGVLGVVTTTANQNNVLLSGMVRVSQSLAGFTNGSPVYLATASAGTITQTPPSTGGHVARYVGYVIDSGSREIYFNPDFTWIQL